MKRHLVYLLAFLCCALVSCKDDENKDEDDGRIYPEEPQTPFQVTNRKGMLMFDIPKDDWRIWCYPESNKEPRADTIFLVENMPKDIRPQSFIDVTFSGEATYLYYKKMISGEITHYFSMNVSEITPDVDAQTKTANSEMLGCGTPAPEPPLWFFEPQTRSVSLNNYQINVFVHVVRSSSGNGLNKNVVSQTVINNLNEYYENSYLSFRIVGDEYIDSDNLNEMRVANSELLFNRNGHNKALDIYVLSSGSGFSQDNTGGIARSIPATACIINSYNYMSSTLPHEVGHCLGLYHTHHGTYWRENSGCSELVNGSNSSTCGDYLEDTPADPCEWSGCTYVGTITDANGDFYHPDPSNFMSYSGCRKRFTQRQIERMNAIIQKTLEIREITVQPKIVGPSHFCTNDIYTVEGLLDGESVSWEVTTYSVTSGMDDQPLSKSVDTYSDETLTLRNYNYRGWPQYYEIKAIITHINGGTKNAFFRATSDVPSPYMGTLYWLADDGQYGETTNMNHGNTLYVSGDFSLTLVYEDKAGNMSNPYGTDYFKFVAYGKEHSNRITFSLQDCMSSGGAVRINARNDCGISSNAFFISCEYANTLYSSVYLPESAEIEVKAVHNTAVRSAEQKNIMAIDIYDCDNQNVYSKIYSTGVSDVKISTTGWNPGEYIVKIYDGEKIYNRKIII